MAHNIFSSRVRGISLIQEGTFIGRISMLVFLKYGEVFTHSSIADTFGCARVQIIIFIVGVLRVKKVEDLSILFIF
ncbi:MAG: hypothetical protein LBC61_04970 [Candidatus Peribacteria bacterium]|nr:hypothetical protein [Candidatus Peribacteria bacterium]